MCVCLNGQMDSDQVYANDISVIEWWLVIHLISFWYHFDWAIADFQHF